MKMKMKMRGDDPRKNFYKNKKIKKIPPAKHNCAKCTRKCANLLKELI